MPTQSPALPALTQRVGNPRHLNDEDRMAAVIALVGAIKQLQASGPDTTEASLHVREIERHTAQLRAAGEDRALAIMAYLIDDVINTAAMRMGTTWEAAWEAAARQARVAIARMVNERGKYDENRPDNRSRPEARPAIPDPVRATFREPCSE
jgi:hypothetical protein